MGKIKLLPESLVNRIAAGEVVERPASVVKELLENSLDAEADRIEVELDAGGCRQVKVSDNGVGMTPEDLALAWLRHATSKLSDAEQIACISTLGFRGEALPSIGAVSQATTVSRARGALEGAKITVHGGAVGQVAAVGAPEGTMVEVRNLFFNTPVRQKFLRAPKTEEAHSIEAFTRLALAHPKVAFRLSCGGKQLLHLPGGVTLLERIRGLFGNELAGQLAPAQRESGALRISGYIGHPQVNRSNGQMIYTFLNGRYIRDKLLARAIADTYRSLLPAGRFPVVLLHLELEPSRVDVNVHPCKTEVRFREPQAVYEAVLRATQTAAQAWSGGAAPAATQSPQAPPEARRQEIKQAIADFFASRPGPRRPEPEPAPAAAPRREPPQRFCQFRASYIVEETTDGINLIDQHALHERILYEALAPAATRPIQVQRLLAPEVVELNARDFRLVLELRPMLARMGIELEEFGGHSVAVRGLPQLLGQAPPGPLVVDLLDQLHGENESIPREELLRRLMACKAAVKAGQLLTQEQIGALLRRRDELKLPPTCPHGRPTTLHLSDDEIARKFRRT